jgi:hypothetical protein
VTYIGFLAIEDILPIMEINYGVAPISICFIILR